MNEKSSEWKEYRIDELGQVVTGHTPLKSEKEYYESNDFTWIKPTDIRKGERYVSETEEYYSQKAYEKYKNALLPPLSTCVVTIGTVGEKICLTDKSCFTNQSINAIIPNREKFDPMFVYYLLKYNLDQVAQRNPGTASGRHHVSKSNLSSIIVKAPFKPTQLKISSILARYDDLLENNTRRIKILEEMAQGIYREWFVHFRFPGHEGVRMVESELGMIPEGWEISKIDKVCSRIASGGTPARNNEDYWTSGTITWYKTKELQDSFLFDSEEKISDDGLTNSSAKFFPKNSIVIALYASPTLGRLGILTHDSTFNQAMCGLIANEKITNNYYLFFSLLNNRAYFQHIALGAAQQNINAIILRSTPILIPKKELTDEFQKKIDSIYLDIKNLLMKNINLRRTRDLLLPKLISGEMDVSKLDIMIPEAMT